MKHVWFNGRSFKWIINTVESDVLLHKMFCHISREVIVVINGNLKVYKNICLKTLPFPS